MNPAELDYIAERLRTAMLKEKRYSIAEAAEQLKISERSVRQLLNENKLGFTYGIPPDEKDENGGVRITKGVRIITEFHIQEFTDRFDSRKQTNVPNRIQKA